MILRRAETNQPQPRVKAKRKRWYSASAAPDFLKQPTMEASFRARIFLPVRPAHPDYITGRRMSARTWDGSFSRPAGEPEELLQHHAAGLNGSWSPAPTDAEYAGAL